MLTITFCPFQSKVPALNEPVSWFERKNGHELRVYGAPRSSCSKLALKVRIGCSGIIIQCQLKPCPGLGRNKPCLDWGEVSRVLDGEE